VTPAERAIVALRAGELVVLPTDTVYGLACLADDEPAARRLYALKGRPAIQPTAIVFATVEVLLDAVPELVGDAATIASALLPGPYTLVVPNPARRLPWLNAERPDAIGVRVPTLPAPAQAVLHAVGAVVATSANLAGGPDPRRVADVPPEIVSGVRAVIDGGELAGVPSTVVDLTEAVPTILREGAVPAAEALHRVATALDRERARSFQ
jgi:L-threonylcarbamoyladenylate synthase